MALDEKKYLDKDGVSALFTKVLEQINEHADQPIDNLKKQIGTVPDGKDVVTMISDAQKAATYDDTDVKAGIQSNKDAIATLNGANTVEGSVAKQIKDATDDVNAKVATLIGDDANKSARTIANEELTKQLIPENAQESMDTLQEISNWIQSHPGEASAMNTAIEANKAAIGDVASEGKEATGLRKDIADLKAADTSASGALATETSRAKAAEQANADAIAVINGDATTTGSIAKAQADAEAYADGLAGNYATKAQGAKADSALQASDIATGTDNGTLSIKGTNVAVKGLGSAAYTDSTAYDAAGAANEVYAAIVPISTTETDADSVQKLCDAAVTAYKAAHQA